MTDSMRTERKAVEKASEEITKCRIAAGEWAAKVTSAEALLKTRHGRAGRAQDPRPRSKADQLIQLGRDRNRLMYGSYGQHAYSWSSSTRREKRWTTFIK
jgi:hypothetical protein